MCACASNQKFEIVVSTRPLPGIGSGSTTSKALKPVGGHYQHVPVVDRVDVADLALVQPVEPAETGFVHRRRGQGGVVGHWSIPVCGARPRADNILRCCMRRVLQGPSPAVKESMGWYGKLIGAVLGAIIGRGLLGAIVGLLIGHQFDRRSSSHAGLVSRAISTAA